jgi:hypothetical protein
MSQPGKHRSLENDLSTTAYAWSSFREGIICIEFVDEIML